MEILTLENERGNDLLFSGVITEKSAASSSKMKMSGFVSTTDPDLVGDVILPGAFNKHIQKYKDRPIYLYQHDKKIPIGRVSNVITDYTKDGKTGLYLEDIILSDIPVVRDVIWRLVQDEVLTQQSVGMYSIDGGFNPKTKVFEHKEVYLYESSLVSVAANPQALIDIVGKGLPELPLTMEELVKAYDSGKITPAFSISTYVAEKDNSTMMNTPKHPTDPDFSGITLLKHNDSLFDDVEDCAETPFPKRAQKDYAQICDAIHACKSLSRNSYMFQIGVPTEKGFRYDWELTATAMSRLLGANGGAHYDVEEKSLVANRIAEAYTRLEKSLPTYDGVAVTDLAKEVLHEASYKDFKFSEGEPEIYQLAVFEKDIQRIADTITSFKKSGTIPPFATECLKWLYATVEIDIEGTPEYDSEVEFVAKVAAMIAEFRNKRSAEINGSMMVELSADETAMLKQLVEPSSTEVETTDTFEVSEDLIKQLERAGIKLES